MHARKRILVLSSTYPRWADDSIPGFVHELSKRLVGEFDVRVVCPHASGAARREVLDGVRIHRFRYGPGRLQALTDGAGIMANVKESPWKIVLLPGFLIGLLWRTFRQIRTWQPDLIHAHWIIPQGLIAVILSRALPGTRKIVLTSHGGDLYGLRIWPFPSIKRWVLRNASAVTVVSNTMAAEVSRLDSRTEPRTMPMGVDLQSRFVPPGGESTRHSQQIITVGRLVEMKGVAVLLHAMELVRNQCPTAILVIVGDGPHRQELETLARRLGLEESAQFLGAVSHSRIPKLLQSSAVSAFPFVPVGSLQEGFGLVVVEAMGCGCAVVASDVPALHGTVIDGETGILVSASDPKALAEALIQLLEDAQFRLKLASAGQEYARFRFDWQRASQAYVDLFRQNLSE